MITWCAHHSNGESPVFNGNSIVKLESEFVLAGRKEYLQEGKKLGQGGKNKGWRWEWASSFALTIACKNANALKDAKS